MYLFDIINYDMFTKLGAQSGTEPSGKRQSRSLEFAILMLQSTGKTPSEDSDWRSDRRVDVGL